MKNWRNNPARDCGDCFPLFRAKLLPNEGMQFTPEYPSIVGDNFAGRPAISCPRLFASDKWSTSEKMRRGEAATASPDAWAGPIFQEATHPRSPKKTNVGPRTFVHP